MGSSATGLAGQSPATVTDEDLALAFELFREDQFRRLAVTSTATVRLRGFEMRVEDAEDVLAASVLETVRAVRKGKIVIKGDETAAQAVRRRMHIPIRNRVIDSFRERRPREEFEVLTDPSEIASLPASSHDAELVETFDTLREIPAADRALLIESIALGTPDDELAERERVTPAAIRQRRRRILARLRGRPVTASNPAIAEAA